MLPIISKLHGGSFRKAAFLIGDASTVSGRKQVSHEFPNTDRRTVEDLGKLNDIYSIIGFVITKDNFLDRDALKLALGKSGVGELTHPYYGTVNVTSKTFTITENANSVGVARFDMAFEVVQDPVYPSATNVKTSLIKEESDGVLAAVEKDLADTFEVSRQSSSNYAAALEQLQGVGNRFSIIRDTVGSASRNLNEFTAAIIAFNNGLRRNIFDPITLASSMVGMISQLDTLATSILSQFDLSTSLFGTGANNALAVPSLGQFNISTSLFEYGVDDPLVGNTTIPRMQRLNNQLIINTFVRASSLALAYNNTTQIVYSNESELLRVRETVENEYQSILDNNNLSDDTISLMQGLRNSVRIFFDDISVTVPKIVTVFVREAPMTIHAFNYYGDIERTKEMISLNEVKDVSFVSRDIDILSL